MGQKIENFQYPGWGKSEEKDADFEREAEKLAIERDTFLMLKKSYQEKKKILDEREEELSSLEKEGKLTIQDRKTLENTIAALKEELLEMDARIKMTAKKVADVISDPRHSQLRFRRNQEEKETQ